MVTISASLLACNFAQIESEIKSFNEFENIWFHLDIMDGHFVPNLTFGHPVVSLLAPLTKHKLDAHLMVTNPVFYIETFKNFSIHNLTFHYESTVHHDRIIHLIKENYPSVGLSLNPSTPLEIIPDYILQMVDLVLIMSVNPGFGGQKFISPILSKVRSLHEKRSRLKANFHIQVDGGINEKNAKDLIEAGADNLVIGSYLFQGGSTYYSQRINSIRRF